MKISFLSLALLCTLAHADPQISSCFMENSGQDARIYSNTAAETANIPVTTCSRGQRTQSSTIYTDISEVSYSAATSSHADHRSS